jgi:hypothetical protein
MRRAFCIMACVQLLLLIPIPYDDKLFAEWQQRHHVGEHVGPGRGVSTFDRSGSQCGAARPGELLEAL